jgi:hypothetical protein
VTEHEFAQVGVGVGLPPGTPIAYNWSAARNRERRKEFAVLAVPLPGLIAGIALATRLVFAPVPAPAQTSSSGLIGRIFDEKTNQVLTDVLILVDSTRRDVMVSSQGRFVLTNLASGRHRVEIRAIGYRPQVLEVTLLDGQVLEREFPMPFTGDRLPDLAIEARNSKLLPRFADFERRRVQGMGVYITRDEIRARGYMRMGDALRTVQGVRVDCAEVDCVIHMVRATAGCYPAFYVDGRLARSFATSTPMSDVQGIEVYRGAAEMPGEFTGAGAMCGVIAIWTRAAP